MITVMEFVQKYDGQPIDVDGVYSGQCWDLVALYNQEVIGIPASQSYGLPTGPNLAAKEVYEYFEDPLSDYFIRLDRGAVPVTGDVVVWSSLPGSIYGHIAVFLNGTLDNFNSFDQNWPTGSVCHVQGHSWANVLGFLRPRVNVNTKGMFMIDENLLFNYYRYLLGRPPDPQGKAQFLGKPADVVFDALVNSDEYKNLHNNPGSPVNKDSVVKYIQDNLK